MDVAEKLADLFQSNDDLLVPGENTVYRRVNITCSYSSHVSHFSSGCLNSACFANGTSTLSVGRRDLETGLH